MNEIDLVRTDKGLRGWTEEDHASWLKFKAWLENLEPGECVRIGYTKPRNPQFHRKLFAALKLAYDHWDPASQRKRRSYKGVVIAKNFEAFRHDILILAGFYEATYGLGAKLELRAKSISFAKMDSEEFEKCYTAVVDVLLSRILTNYKRADVDDVVARMMEFAL